MRDITAKALHILAAVVGFIGSGLIIIARAIEYRAVHIERGPE